MSKKYVITTNAGGIEETKEYLASEAVKYFDTIADAFTFLIEDSVKLYGRPAFFYDDLLLKFQSFDKRINANRYMIVTRRYLEGKFDIPQHLRWLLEFDVDVE